MTLSFAVLTCFLLPQTTPGVDDQKVAAAIERGVAWLRQAPSPGSRTSVRFRGAGTTRYSPR